MSIGLEVKEVTTQSPHGIYLYDPSKDVWRLIATEGDPYIPKEDGAYVIYFDNTKCPACRRYDPIWFGYIRSVARKLENYRFVIVLCDWFARECKSTAAANTFRHYDVHASPTTILLYVKNGKEVYRESYEGVLKEDELKAVVEGFVERAEKAMRGEKVEKPIKKEEADVAELIKLLLAIIKSVEKEERSAAQEQRKS